MAGSISRFDVKFNEWLQENHSYIDSFSSESVSSIPDEFLLVEQTFKEIREMLDKAGESVQSYARSMEQRTTQQIQTYHPLPLLLLVLLL